MGLEKYGVTLAREDLSHADWLRHLQEELLDGAGYIEAAIAKAEQAEALAERYRLALEEIVNLCDMDAEHTGRTECKVAEHAIARAALSGEAGDGA